MFEEVYFERKKPCFEKLLHYGFQQKAQDFQYERSIMQGQFLLYVFIDREGSVSTQMMDSVTGEEYLMYKVPSSVGAFVGQAREACENILKDIAVKCFETDIFHGDQVAALVEFVGETYGDQLEFLWEKFPNNAVWRRSDNGKWYGAILTIPRRKLGLPSDEIVEIIDLRIDPSQMATTVDQKFYFPGWHMNKKNWYTIILDGSVPLDELYQRIKDSYMLAIK